MTTVLRPACLLLLLCVAGCDQPDPMQKPYTWSLPPAGLTANEENLRTMLVNPNDLVAGTGETTSEGNLAAAPMQRLITGRRYKLPAVIGSEIPGTTEPSASQGGGGGAGTQ